jgi:hypothetical protein
MMSFPYINIDKYNVSIYRYYWIKDHHRTVPIRFKHSSRIYRLLFLFENWLWEIFCKEICQWY